MDAKQEIPIDEKGQVKQELTVGEVAKRSGIAVSAVHFYEAKGLIQSRRSPGNHRLYPREVLRRIAVIKVAQRTGLSLDEIRRALATLPDDRAPTKADWTRLSESWKAELEERIVRLMRLRDQLDRCIGCGCLSISDCPLRNPDDRLAAEGPGPRLLERGPRRPEPASPRKEPGAKATEPGPGYFQLPLLPVDQAYLLQEPHHGND